MKHIDILIHVLCLSSGIVTALLGFLLYLKYKLKVIRNYALFIMTTIFTVAATTLFSYVSYFMNIKQNPLSTAIGVLVFCILLSMLNYTFSLFALGIMNRKPAVFNRLLMNFPWFIDLISLLTLIYFNAGGPGFSIQPVFYLFNMIIIFNLFLSFVIYSIQIAVNLKNMDNLDLKRALKILAFLFIIYIPLQAIVIILIKQPVIIFLSRNLFYFAVNIISIIFAAKYFFIEMPSIIGPIEISSHFISIYEITEREKEVILLLLSGLSIKEISGKLNRSFKTVNNHIYNIYQKARVSSKLELLNVIKENKI